VKIVPPVLGKEVCWGPSIVYKGCKPYIKKTYRAKHLAVFVGLSRKKIMIPPTDYLILNVIIDREDNRSRL